MIATSTDDFSRLSRRRFVGLLGAAGLGAHTASRPVAAVPIQSAPPSTSELVYLSTTALAGLIREKQVSSRDVVRACLARIAEVNPTLNAVVQECAERALEEADARDALTARGEFLGPLHGVPMTVKDSFDTAGVVSTGGTLGRKGHVPERDATIVERLRAAGAILLGKTNTPELTLGSGGKGTHNLVYGETRNPYDLDYRPSSSSGGAAAIVAAGGAPFDIGSDFGGSIRLPCHACGVVGLKPTSGRVPRTGHIIGYGGVFDAFQQMGPIVRRVEDVMPLLRVIAGPDGLDAGIVAMPLGDPARVSLRGLRVACYTTNGEVDPIPEIQRLVEDAAAMMTEQGARVAEARPSALRAAAEVRGQLQAADGHAFVRRIIDAAGTERVSEFLRVDGDVATAAEFTALAERLDRCRSEMLDFMKDYDVIVCPASPFPARRLDSDRDETIGTYTAVYNTTGWPAGVIRTGTSSENLPLGVQIVGRPWADHVVVAVLAFLEGRTGGWRPPALGTASVARRDRGSEVGSAL